jgi:hypothetical protein
MGFNTSNLTIILNKLNLLLDEVQNAEPSSNDSVKIFVELKHEAKNLTKQFREVVKELLGDHKIKELREQVKEMAGEKLQNYSKKIRNRIKQFNRNQLHRLYGFIGEYNGSLLEDYENGNISLEELKSQIHKIVNQMTKNKKYQIFSDVKEDNIRKKIKAQDSAGNIHNKGKGKGKPK